MMAQWTALDRQTRRASRGAALIAALAAGLAAGCAPERGKSCGDGWWDPDFEQCDPRAPDSPHLDPCGDMGITLPGELGPISAVCDPVTCSFEVQAQMCNYCGDGVAAGAEQCDGKDLRGATCGTNDLRCSSDCTLDYSGCPASCGDGVITDNEECEPGLSCANDEDCPDDTVCYELYGECIPSEDTIAPNLSCVGYTSKVIGGSDKPYTSGTIDRCTQECFFGRNDCGFCGDGELDEPYLDLVYPTGEPVEFPAEVCDGEEADPDKLFDYCKPRCTSEAINADVMISCDFECNAGCTDFAEPSDFVTPEGIGCCLTVGSPCVPGFDGAAGIPDLPCCSWLDNPDWLAERKCVVKETNVIPVGYVCP